MSISKMFSNIPKSLIFYQISLTLKLTSANSNLENKHEIRSSHNNLCLSLTHHKTMAAYDPVTNTHGGWPVLTWEACNSENDHGQLFEFKTNNQILTENDKCVTVLPLNSGFHGSSLDPCATWFGLPEAGSYLFAMDCVESQSDYQSFTYNTFTGSFQSNCPHELKLGSVTDSLGKSKGFLTNDSSGNTFPSAQVAQISGGSTSAQAFESIAVEIATNQVNGNNSDDDSNFDLIDISQHKRNAIVEILSEFLTLNEANQITQHGCWCSKIMGANPDFAGNPVDQIDRLCKEWSVTRRCNSLENGGSCPRSSYNFKTTIGLDYTIKRAPINAGKIFSCETVENNMDQCLMDSCLIDATFSVAIYEAIKVEPAWSALSQSENQCQRGNGNGNGGAFQGNFNLVCAGDAPILEIQKVPVP